MNSATPRERDSLYNGEELKHVNTCRRGLFWERDVLREQRRNEKNKTTLVFFSFAANVNCRKTQNSLESYSRNLYSEFPWKHRLEETSGLVKTLRVQGGGVSCIIQGRPKTCTPTAEQNVLYVPVPLHQKRLVLWPKHQDLHVSSVSTWQISKPRTFYNPTGPFREHAWHLVHKIKSSLAVWTRLGQDTLLHTNKQTANDPRNVQAGLYSQTLFCFALSVVETSSGQDHRDKQCQIKKAAGLKNWVTQLLSTTFGYFITWAKMWLPSILTARGDCKNNFIGLKGTKFCILHN